MMLSTAALVVLGSRLPFAAHTFQLPAARPLQLVVNYVFPGAIMLLAVVMMIWHWRTWRLALSHGVPDAEQGYQRRRFRRRMQTSFVLAIIGAALIIGQWIPPLARPSLYVFFWCGVVLLVLWVIVLAGADFAAASTHLSRLHRQRAAERSRLQAELIRLARERKDRNQRREPQDN